MEEDIKILFNLIDVLNTGMCKFQENIRLDDCGYQEALENLIKRRRELEETIEIMQHNYTVAIRETIHKSKVKEIRDKAEVMDYYTLPDVIDDLNKLLGDEE